MGLYIRGLSITFDMKFLIVFAFFAVAANAAVFIPPQPQPNIIGGWTPDFLKKPIQKPAIIGGWTPDFLKKPAPKPVIFGGWTPDFLKKPVMPKPVIVGGWTPAPKCVPHVKIVPRVCVPRVCVPVRHYCAPVRRYCAPRVVRRSRCCYVRRRYC